MVGGDIAGGDDLDAAVSGHQGIQDDVATLVDVDIAFAGDLGGDTVGQCVEGDAPGGHYLKFPGQEHRRGVGADGIRLQIDQAVGGDDALLHGQAAVGLLIPGADDDALRRIEPLQAADEAADGEIAGDMNVDLPQGPELEAWCYPAV